VKVKIRQKLWKIKRDKRMKRAGIRRLARNSRLGPCETITAARAAGSSPINEKHCRGTGNRMPDPELEARRQNAGK